MDGDAEAKPVRLRKKSCIGGRDVTSIPQHHVLLSYLVLIRFLSTGASKDPGLEIRKQGAKIIWSKDIIEYTEFTYAFL